MFTKAQFLSAALLLCSVVLFSQKPVVKISPEFKLPKSRSFQSHLFSDASGHYMYFYEGSGGMFGSGSTTVVLEKYDPKFKQVYSKEYTSDRKGISSMGLRYFNGQFVWLFSEDNKKEDYIRYSLLPIDLNGKQGKATDIAKFKYESRSDIPRILWNISKDSSKLLFRAVSDHDKDDEKFGIFLSVLDAKLQPMWSRKVTLQHTEEQTEVISTVLKNDGSVYMLCKVYEGKKAKESKKNAKKKSVAAYEMVLYHFTQAEQEPKEFRLKLGELFIKGASLATNDQDELKCAGFFSTTRNGSLNGVFFLQLAPDGSVTASSKKEFTAADLKKFGEKNTDKDKGGDEGLEASFKFSDFLIRKDGSAVVVAEENYSVTYSSYNGRTWTYTTYYYSNDIVAFTITNKGEVERINVIPKRQVGVNTNYFTSYAALIRDNDIVFFYNEDEDNMEKPVNNPKPKLVNKFNDCVAVMTTLAPDGKLTRKQLFEAKDVESLFVPDDSTPFDDNKLFFVSFKPRLLAKSNFHIGTVELPK
ncbi:MAG TPA: hypothetical protein PK971_09200 [Saprospiraceae bacterium]|nr:hypothetical protein [Saprospiraceae bacterium]HND88494.1 hypothetical protein [Saprospiraceae bacterium]